MLKRFFVTAIILIVGVGSASAQYYYTDLGLGGNWSTGSLRISNAVNANGGAMVVGTAGGDAQIWNGASAANRTGVLTDITPSWGISGTAAWGISSDGTKIVGKTYTAADGSVTNAFFHNADDPANTSANLGYLPGGGAYSTASSVNNSGVAVGTAEGLGGAYDYQAVYWSNDHTIHTLPNFVTSGVVTGGASRITNNGYITGECESDGIGYAALWTPNGSGGYTVANLTAGTTPAWASNNGQAWAFGLNSSASVVGTACLWGNVNPDSASVLFSGGQIVPLVATGDNYDTGQANAVNSGGVIVGRDSFAFTGGPNGGGVAYTGSVDAFVYKNGVMADLNAPGVLGFLPAGFKLWSASDVNDAGQVVGFAKDSTNHIHTFLLNPALPGDSNLDGKVDINDLSKVLTNYDKTGVAWADGDFNADGKVDINDLSIVLTNYDHSISASAGSLAAVPEPGTVALLGAALAGLLVVVARRRP